MINAYKMFVGKSEGKRPILRPSCVDGKIILKWILNKQVRRVWTGLIFWDITPCSRLIHSTNYTALYPRR
jgi:hypothetical protein